MQFTVSRIDNKGKRAEVTKVYADAFATSTTFDILPYTRIVFFATEKKWLRADVNTPAAELLVCGDYVIENA